MDVIVAGTERHSRPKFETVYLTANLWYTGKLTKNQSIHIKQKCATFLSKYIKPFLTRENQFDGKLPISITTIYTSTRKGFDIGNKCYFWTKYLEDFLVNRKILPDDSVQYVTDHNYRYVEGKLKLKFIIEEKDGRKEHSRSEETDTDSNLRF